MSNISWGVRIALTATLLVTLSSCAAMQRQMLPKQRQTLPNFSDKAKIHRNAAEAAGRGDYGTWFAGQMSLAEKDDPYAMGSVAFAYRFGRGVTRNLSEAERWYRRAAERGNQGAKYFLKKDSEGDRPQNLSELADWVRPDAERGVAFAQWALASAYREGWGVLRNAPPLLVHSAQYEL